MAKVRMLQKARKTDSEPTAPPRQGLVDALINNSVSDNFEDARREWAFDGDVITWESKGFNEHCPCGAKLELQNYLLINHQTGIKIKLGSRCIRRFVILTGTDNQEDSARAFDRMVSGVNRNAALVRLRPAMFLPRVKVQQLNRFRSLAEQFLGTLEPSHINEERWSEFRRLLELGDADREELKRLRSVLFKPGEVPKDDSVIHLESISEDKFREQNPWRKKSRARVETSLSDSEIYHPARFVERKNGK